MNESESVSEMGVTDLAVAAGDGQEDSFSNGKAGPAEVPVSAGNVPATGRWGACKMKPKVEIDARALVDMLILLPGIQMELRAAFKWRGAEFEFDSLAEAATMLQWIAEKERATLQPGAGDA